MHKAARIKAFVDLHKKNNVITVSKSSQLFEKLKQNVQKEYRKFHKNREPKINNLEVVLNGFTESSNQAGYLQNADFVESFSKFKETQELPFSIMQEIRRPTNDEEDEGIFFPSQHIIKTSYFVASSFSRETFHQIQRQHKIWWMKYGASPGNYSISDQKSELFYKFVSIRSNIDDSLIDVERLRMFSLKDSIKDKESLNAYLSRVPNRKKEVVPDVIESTVDLQVASLALLLDALVLSGEDYIALHRRSAPYQIALVIKGISKDLVDLARYIELLVRSTEPEIEILNHSNNLNSNETCLEKQFQYFDGIGIPYAIILEDSALETGLFKLRNRNTTLMETIHLCDVTKYLIKIFNSG